MIEVWGGMECTVNRVGNRYCHQSTRSRHEFRVDDIDRFHDLGLKRLRYPLLWERLAPQVPGRFEWEHVDRHMARMHEVGLAPIGGLVHHGSGPRYTDLLDPLFGEKLAMYASAVANRYPWVRAWTPVNEPLTTARFSGLYGHWHPHGRSDPEFVRILFNECRGIALAMRAIRNVVPDAELVYTDDGGTIYSTPPLAYQAEFENRRRDLALDLLFGRVNATHPLYSWLRRHGATDAGIAWFEEHRTPPDIIGIDYYVTSDRYLDHHLAAYPPDALGGNGRHRYADVSAPGRLPGWRAGFGDALHRLWSAYRAPVALTEVHIHCTREEQLRWLRDAWEGAHEAASRGADVRAITGWALLGAYDWDSLATVDAGHYEVGAFDLRSSPPRRTAIGQAIQTLATGQQLNHPVLAQEGWWQRPTVTTPLPRRSTHRRLLIVGAKGTLGSAFVRASEERGLDYLALSRAEVDVTDRMGVARAVAACRPWAVVNATGFVDVDAAEQQHERCHEVNAQGAVNVAEACDRNRAKLVTFSTDLVFDGNERAPYLEHHNTNPLNVYGASKRKAEEAVRGALASALVVRTSAFFGPWDSHNFLSRTFRRLALGETVEASTAIVSPTYVPALVHACLDLLVDGEDGIWHLANTTAVSWAEFARLAGLIGGFDTSRVVDGSTTGDTWTAPRPAYSALGSDRGVLLPTLEHSIEAWMAALPGAAGAGKR